MTKDRWTRINQIFHAALEVAPEQRAALIESHAGGDRELQMEVEHLLEADSEAGSYFDAPPVPSLAGLAAPVVAGEVLCGRFRIVREIAEGGMGHVFEAIDTELAVRVAIKIIRPEIALQPDVISRFRQEVRLARSITHPAVCRTFDLEREVRTVNGQPGELVFLTMEYLPGETLAARLQKNGPLPLDEAFAVARSVADALNAAHRLGVVHRDLKPANIMLPLAEASSPQSQSSHNRGAVVTDFGLARLGLARPGAARLDSLLPADGISMHSQPGVPVGTLSYMAPEQLSGDPVSPATDIYAFGLVLFEMVTGKRAFPSKNLLSGIAQRLKGAAPAELQDAAIPEAWRETIVACLSAEPGNRPADAGSVMRLLEHPTRRRFPRLRDRLRLGRRRPAFVVAAVLALILVVAVSLFAGGFRLYQQRVAAALPPGALIYLAPVINQTGDPSLDSVTELLRAGLSQSSRITLLDQGHVGETLQHMTRPPDARIDAVTAREIALRSSAVRVVFVTVSGARGSFKLNAEVQEPDSSPSRYREHWSHTFAWKSGAQTPPVGKLPPELLAQVRDASDWIRNTVGESSADVARQNASPEDVTTSDWHALAAYSEAERLNAAHRTSDAIVALQEAVAIDPHFAFAYARLGDLLLSANRYREGYEAYGKAFGAENVQHLTRREQDQVRGIAALDTHDYETSERLFRDLNIYYENDFAAWFYHAASLLGLGRVEEAVASMQHAVALKPSSSASRLALASYLFIAHQDAAAQTQIAALDATGPNEQSTWLHAEDLYLQLQLEEASRQLTLLMAQPAPALGTLHYSQAALFLAEQGRFAEGIPLFTQAMAIDRAAGNPGGLADDQIGRASLECRVKQYDSCLNDIKTALHDEHGPKNLRAADRILGSALANVSAPLAVRMRQVIEENLKGMPPDDIGPIIAVARAEGRAELLLSRGQTAEAVLELRHASTLDAVLAPRNLLADALVAETRHSAAAARGALLGEARSLYRTAALEPAFLWYQGTRYSPAARTDSLGAWLQLAVAESLNQSVIDAAAAAELRQAAADFAKLRPQEYQRIPGLPHAVERWNHASALHP